MIVYSDIVEQSMVGNSQLLIIGFFPIKSKFQELGQCVFNPPMFVKVRKQISELSQ